MSSKHHRKDKKTKKSERGERSERRKEHGNTFYHHDTSGDTEYHFEDPPASPSVNESAPNDSWNQGFAEGSEEQHTTTEQYRESVEEDNRGRPYVSFAVGSSDERYNHPETHRPVSVDPNRPSKPRPKPAPTPQPNPPSKTTINTADQTIPIEYTGPNSTYLPSSVPRSLKLSPSIFLVAMETEKQKLSEVTAYPSNVEDSYISAQLAGDLTPSSFKKRKAIYTDTSTNKSYDCKLRIAAKVIFDDQTKNVDVQLYVLPKGCVIHTHILLGTKVLGYSPMNSLSDSMISATTDDSGYGTGHSRHPSSALPFRTTGSTYNGVVTSPSYALNLDPSNSPTYSYNLNNSWSTAYQQPHQSDQLYPGSGYADDPNAAPQNQGHSGVDR